jgi:hypothetical protein
MSRIRHSDGHLLVETVRKNNIVEFIFPGVKLVMDVGNQTLVGTSERDKEELEKFLQSSDATLARKCIASLIQAMKQNKEMMRRNDGRKVVPLGLLLTGMLLGEEPAVSQPTVAPQSKNNHARGGRSSPVSLNTKAGNIGAGRQDPDRCPFGPTQGCFGGSDCNGCCGAGCECSGFYTTQCLAHDNCVGSFGQLSCVSLFPASAASLVVAYERGYGDWPPGGSDDGEDDYYLEFYEV